MPSLAHSSALIATNITSFGICKHHLLRQFPPSSPLKANRNPSPPSNTSSPEKPPPKPPTEPSSPNRALGSDMWLFPWDRAKEQFSPAGYYKEEYAFNDELWSGNSNSQLDLISIFRDLENLVGCCQKLDFFGSFGVCEFQVFFINTHMEIGSNNFRKLWIKFYLLNKAFKMFDKMLVRCVVALLLVALQFSFLDHLCNAKAQASAMQTLWAVSRIPPSPLATQLPSPSFEASIFGHAPELSYTNSSIVYSLSVCISLLDPKTSIHMPDIYDAKEDQRALGGDDVDVYCDNESARVVISSLRLGDNQGSNLFTNSNWFSFQDKRTAVAFMNNSLTASVVKMEIKDWVTLQIVVQEWLKLPWPPPRERYHKQPRSNFWFNWMWTKRSFTEP